MREWKRSKEAKGMVMTSVEHAMTSSKNHQTGIIFESLPVRINEEEKMTTKNQSLRSGPNQ
jgi:hypothetical protein